MAQRFFLTSTLDGGGWLTLRPGRFNPGKEPVHNVQEAVWAPEEVWTGTENFDLHRDSIPALSKSLYRLSYPEPLQHEGFFFSKPVTGLE